MMPIGMVTPKSTGKRVRKSTRKPKLNVKLGNSVHGEVLDALIRGVVQRSPTFFATSASDNQGNIVATPDVEVDSVNSDINLAEKSAPELISIIESLKLSNNVSVPMAGNYSSSGAISSASDISVRVDDLDKNMVNISEKLTQMGELIQSFFSK